MSGLVFEAVKDMSKATKLLTWDQICINDDRIKDKRISRISLKCSAGDVAILEVQHYKNKDDGSIDLDGDIDMYYIGNSSNDQILLPILLYNQRIEAMDDKNG